MSIITKPTNKSIKFFEKWKIGERMAFFNNKSISILFLFYSNYKKILFFNETVSFIQRYMSPHQLICQLTLTQGVMCSSLPRHQRPIKFVDRNCFLIIFIYLLKKKIDLIVNCMIVNLVILLPINILLY